MEFESNAHRVSERRDHVGASLPDAHSALDFTDYSGYHAGGPI